MKLIKATDLIPVENPTIVIVSDPGVGKTTLGYGADRALLLDYDLGAHRAKNRRETLQPDNWKDAETILERPEILKEAFGKSLDDFGTFVVDTAGRALDLLAAELISTNPKAGRDGGLSIQGWGMLKNRFTTFKNRLAHQKKGLVLLCHGKEEKDGDNKIVRPDIQGGSLGEILKSADVLGYLHIVDGKRRVIDWNPSTLKARVAFRAEEEAELGVPETAVERRYALRQVQQRLHQATFREAVITAYRGRCALSGLREPVLLDAAHIIEDKHERLGQPVVQNGIPLAKTHHAAFDAHLIGIDPDFRIHVAERILRQKDGPTLEALKRLHANRIYLPSRGKDRPDQDRLAMRFAQFKERA
jgi:hypothetical protein